MRITLAIASAVLLCAEVRAQERIELNSHFCRDYFFVGVTLAPREGYPEDRTLWFVHDTGAGSTFVDPDALERVTGRQDLAGMDRVNIVGATSGEVNINRMPARVQDLDHLVHASAAARERHAVDVELFLHPTAARAQHEAPA